LPCFGMRRQTGGSRQIFTRPDRGSSAAEGAARAPIGSFRSRLPLRPAPSTINGDRRKLKPRPRLRGAVGGCLRLRTLGKGFTRNQARPAHTKALALARAEAQPVCRGCSRCRAADRWCRGPRWVGARSPRAAAVACGSLRAALLRPLLPLAAWPLVAGRYTGRARSMAPTGRRRGGRIARRLAVVSERLLRQRSTGTPYTRQLSSAAAQQGTATAGGCERARQIRGTLSPPVAIRDHHLLKRRARKRDSRACRRMRG
jgi:hypothetical protein